MTLTPGTRLGPYEIVSSLGAGGMGQVYRAVDTRLKRQVALKVLPPALATDAERLARFQREAEVLAALNHPHIAHLHGLEDSGSITALVMELVEGEDLATRIAAAPIPVDEALALARQIADALEAAHEQGIVHRDLKPLNIRVRPDGTVKVLDFGLAKALDTANSDSAKTELANSPTRVGPVTASGIILGTAAYMSPEQARGRHVDKRTDIWAFGCVLYEMLTGSRLFAGESAAETLALVFSHEPDLTRLPPTTPPRVRTLLARCLVKDPKQRLRDIGDARLALDGAFDSGSQAATPSGSAQAMGAPAPRRRSPWPVVAAVTLVSTIALAVPALRHLREVPAPPPPETRLEIVTPDTDKPVSFALSPDGRRIVFVATGDGGPRLWLRSLDSTTAEPLAGTEGASFPFWSPDSSSIGFFTPSALKRLDLASGTPLTLAKATVGTGASWNADGVILFAPSNGSLVAPLMRVSSNGGEVVPVTTLGPHHTGHRSPYFLPDGRTFLFVVYGPPQEGGIYVGALGDSTITRLTASETEALWLPPKAVEDQDSQDGWLVWVRPGTRTLVAQRLDLESRALVGPTETLADGVAIGSLSGTVMTVAASVSRAGQIAYRQGGDRRRLTWFDRTGKVLGTEGEPDGSWRNPRVSPDGRRIVAERRAQANNDLWMLDGSRASRFTVSPASDSFAVWSPDGQRLAFAAGPSGVIDLFTKSAEGTDPEESLLVSANTKIPFSWSSDGRFLLYSNYDPKSNADLYIVEVDGSRKPIPILKTPFRETQGMFSPDAKWVAYMSDRSGRNEIYIRPFSASGAEQVVSADTDTLVSTTGGIYPVWRADGKELYYLNPAGALVAVNVNVGGGRMKVGEPQRLFDTHIYGGGIDTQQGRNYDVTADGRFLINTTLDTVTNPITLIQNWNPTPAAR